MSSPLRRREYQRQLCMARDLLGGRGSIYLAVRVGTTVITSQWRTCEGAPRYQSKLASESSVMESRTQPHEEKHD
jgi:hypothetical protein